MAELTVGFALCGSFCTFEKAIDQMELLGHDFFIYLDKETRKTNVIYVRNDGDYAVIETTTK